MSPLETAFAGACFMGFGVALWLLSARPADDIRRFALPTVAALMTPRMQRLFEASRRPLAAGVFVLGLVLVARGAIQSL
jgi:hypothetical protein